MPGESPSKFQQMDLPKMTKSNRVVSPFDANVDAVFRQQISSGIVKAAYQRIGLDVDRFFRDIDDIDIYECPLTKYRFYYPYSLRGDDSFYEDLQRVQSKYYLSDKLEYDLALEKLGDCFAVLEIGCGDGKFLQKLKDAGINGFGLEFNDLAVQKCLSEGLQVKKESIESFAESNREKFDAVVLFQVLEHISDISPFIEAALSCVRKGGKLIFAVPDNSPYYKNFRIYLTLNLPPHHMGLWNAESFKNLEKMFDVTLESIQYDDDYSSFPNYVYFLGDLLVSPFGAAYGNFLLRNLLIVLLLPYTIPIVAKMKLRAELRPHSIIAAFTKT